MIQLLIDNPLLLLFAVAAIGYPLGRLQVKGTSLGVAAVLFVGLAFGALHPDLKLPEIVYLLGLVLTVYTIGLSSGPGFFASFRRKGLRDNLLVAGIICLAAVVVVAASHVLQLKATVAAGVFAGSLTNTPALASILEQISTSASRTGLEQLLNEPVVGYSITYPMGIVGVILAIVLVQRVWRVDYGEEARALRDAGVIGDHLDNRTVRVTRPEATGQPIRDLARQHGWHLVVGRVKRAGHVSLATDQTCFELGDLVTVVGGPLELERVTAYLGEPSQERLELDRTEFDFRRIFVSNPHVAGKRLRDLHLPHRFKTIVTRVRRGDVDWLPDGRTRLELGDRVRVLTHRDNMPAVTVFLGDSYRALSEIDILAFGLGLALGMLLGTIPLPLPGGITVKLGLAGGPLIVALILGALARTGPIVWTLPYSANLTLRQIGLVMFLAGVGTRSGYAFFRTLGEGNGVLVFAAGAIVTCGAALAALVVGRRLFKIPMGVLIGMVAGMQTQPAVLGFALAQSRDESPNIGYAVVFPLATIVKVVLAQAVLMFLMA
ncbi:MAG: TrkA C-terminal domain-containing protein [Planctomycetota bacterium]